MRAWGVDDRITEQVRRDEEFLKESAEAADVDAETLSSEALHGLGNESEQIDEESEKTVQMIAEWFSTLSDKLRSRVAATIAPK